MFICDIFSLPCRSETGLLAGRVVARDPVGEKTIRLPIETMQTNGFAEAVELICEKDQRFHAEGYAFLRDALNFTIKQNRKDRASGSRHISGQELMEGTRVYALREFGPMVTTVLNYWGINETADFGDMVFKLIEAGIFGKNDSDSKEDFKDCYEFHEAFVVPFLPPKRDSSVERPAVSPAAELP